ncbi:MAG: beta-ketoacyl-[acyl-carrier-protein] synthase family protein [Gammaproteobacteria bacterium]|nr:beta-ketoacyl-[acyl-carrier-protein] synthase family protein [Gammaproteobacteria bacterium]
MRIAITGVGCITSIGLNFEEFSNNLIEGVDGIAAITHFDTETVSRKFAAEVKNYHSEDHFHVKKQLPYMDRFAEFSVVSAREAVKDAGLTGDPCLKDASICFGTGVGGLTTMEESYKFLFQKEEARFPPFTLPKGLGSAAASQISLELGIKGPTIGTNSACASSSHAMIIGAMLLQTGQTKIALCGGSEASLTLGGIKVWEALRVLSKEKCQPFSAGRGGVILGEGSGALVLEDFDHAINRGAKIHAELVGFGMSSDAYHIVAPCINGMEKAMTSALLSAKITPEDIQYINAHGSGTLQNDSVETAAIRSVFGDHANKLAVSSTKSMHGHVLGAGSAVEAAACIVALKNQVAPPTINFVPGDPLCDLDYVANVSRSMPIEYVMSNSFAFGGLNASLIFRKTT